jgi:hypothetical protein
MNGELSKNEHVAFQRRSPDTVKIHHCRFHDYKNMLKEREKHIGVLLASIKNALAAIK